MCIEKTTTIVLLPGLNGTEGLFKPLIETAPENFTVHCITYPCNEPKTYEELTSYVLGKLETIRGNYILVGESFSGPISIFVTHQKPKGLIGTILVATFISAPNLQIGRFLPWKLAFLLAAPLFSLLATLSKNKTVSLLKMASLELQKNSPNVLTSRIKQIFAVNAEIALKECQHPILYFRGNRDFIVPKWNLKKILSINPHVNVVRFDAQHFLLQTVPIDAWKAISEFTASHH